MALFFTFVNPGISKFGKEIYGTVAILLLWIAIAITGYEVYVFYPALIKTQYDSSVLRAQYSLMVSNIPLAILASLFNFLRLLHLKRKNAL